MISPSGNTSLAELWRIFCETHFVNVYQIATDQYAKDDFNASYCVGSPMDLCEQLFTETFDAGLISLAASSGRVVDLPPRIDGNKFGFFSTASVFESAIIAKDPDEAGPDGEALTRIGSSQFVPWPHRHGNAEAWRQTYERPNSIEVGNSCRDDVSYHTLPFTFERNRFVVPKVLPAWARDTFHRHDLDVTFPDYGGSTICLHDDRVGAWRRKNINGRKFLNPLLGVPERTGLQGRPQKQEEIWAIYVRLYPDGRTGSWKEVIANVRKASGLDFSEKTLQRAIKAHGPDVVNGTTKTEK